MQTSIAQTTAHPRQSYQPLPQHLRHSSPGQSRNKAPKELFTHSLSLKQQHTRQKTAKTGALSMPRQTKNKPAKGDKNSINIHYPQTFKIRRQLPSLTVTPTFVKLNKSPEVKIFIQHRPHRPTICPELTKDTICQR